MTEAELITRVETVFKEKFGTDPLLIKSPGRVNLIGEHTDYNDGFVLPAAIDKSIILGIAPNGTDEVRTVSVDLEQEEQFTVADLSNPPSYQWAKYIFGAVAELAERKKPVKGFDVVFGGNIPIGAGMSSSAALEGGVLTGLNTFFDLGLTTPEMALIGQKIEHNHVGVMCGVMDQFINLHGESGKVLKLDCRSLDYELVPFDRDDICIVLCDSKVSHNLASSEYNVRRSQCEEGVNHFKKYDSDIKNLRDISIDLFNEHADELEPLIRQRCRFVLEENQRVHDACDALIKGDFESLGKKLLGSHYGLSKDYEVSCEELDILVELARDEPGVFGCRMMGGGFGGCTINLVLENKVEDFASSMKTEYKAKTGIDTEVHVMKIAAGTHLID